MKLPYEILSDYPPILAQRGNAFITNSGCFSLGYQLELPEIYSLSGDDFTTLNEIWEKALKNLPIGCIVHKQDLFLQTPFDASQLLDKCFLEASTKSHFKGRNFLSHTCLLFFLIPVLRLYKK